MSEKLSSPSSSSGYSPRTRGSASSDDSLYITVRKHPPTYVYSNESFEVQLQLEIPKGCSPPTPSSQPIEFGASLHHVKSGRECKSEAILITEPSQIDLSLQNKSCTMKCMIRMDGIQRDQGAALELRFTQKADLSPSATSVMGVSTRPITIVNYKMKITLEDEWDHIWYKDEGGRDKCMELFVAIYDKDGQIRTGEQIPLQPFLCYAADVGNPVKVTNQEILRTLGSSRIHIDKDSGKARIRFRVEDVSKNHQGQDFKLQVGPDPKAKLFKDIAPDYTPAVNVRSKRNKRSRAHSSSGRASGDRRISSPLASRSRYDGPHDATLERPADLSSLRESMKSVLHWADEVVNGLYPLQWQIVGYAQHPDGTPDYSSPYHNMPNPNGCINRILSMYSESVRGNLRLISNGIDTTLGSGSGPGPGLRPPEQPYLPAPGVLQQSDDPYGMMRGQSSPMNPQVGLPTQSVNRRLGIHPTMVQDTFRDKPETAMQPFQARGQMPSMHQPDMGVSIPGRQLPGPFVDAMHPNQVQHRRMIPQQQVPSPHPGLHLHPDVLNESVETEVAYVLAKQYKAARTGERLGFPAYNANKEILGFYRESNGKVGVGSFHPLSRHRNDFGPLEVLQANEIFERAVANKSDAVHALKDWGTMANLLDHALVYDWSKDIGADPSNSSSE